MNNNNIKDEFISTLSHEIRTPLTSIKGFSKTMLENWDKLDGESKKRFIKIIEEQSQRLINLVENVLNVAKLNSDDDIVLKETDITSLVKKTVELIKISKKEKNIKIAQEDIPKSLTDKDKLEQVFLNVIENACKYSPNDTDIEISIKNTGKYNIVLVKNYGSYIEESSKDKIFEKFYRANNYLTAKTQGSGLGLYIAKTIMNQLKGKIEVHSDKEIPCCEFAIYVPVFELEDITKKVKTRAAKNV